MIQHLYLARSLRVCVIYALLNVRNASFFIFLFFLCMMYHLFEIYARAENIILFSYIVMRLVILYVWWKNTHTHKLLHVVVIIKFYDRVYFYNNAWCARAMVSINLFLSNLFYIFIFFANEKFFFFFPLRWNIYKRGRFIPRDSALCCCCGSAARLD